MLADNQLFLKETKQFVSKEGEFRSKFLKSVTKYVLIANSVGKFYLFKV